VMRLAVWSRGGQLVPAWLVTALGRRHRPRGHLRSHSGT
jgi:hypothetical protein